MKKGFTLIELLVTVSIIGILIAIGVSNFGVANKKARDGKRKGDLEQIKAALELYRTDEGDYPSEDIIAVGEIESAGGTTYMQDVPEDPLSSYTYYYSSDGTTYDLCAALELDTTGVCGGADCGETCNYLVESPL